MVDFKGYEAQAEAKAKGYFATSMSWLRRNVLGVVGAAVFFALVAYFSMR